MSDEEMRREAALSYSLNRLYVTRVLKLSESKCASLVNM